MRDLYKKLITIREQKKVVWETIELDYALSWILAGISEHPLLRNNIVFKGGTALKKCYFGEYRFSEDLDFSEIARSNDEELEQAIIEVANAAQSKLAEFGFFDFEVKRHLEKTPHPFHQIAFMIKAQLPWHRRPMCNIKLEISRSELLHFKPKFCKLLHEYDGQFDYQILTYQLEEIIIEKFRAILENQQRLSNKGWVRSRIRDFYDLWRILDEYKNQLQITVLKEAFLLKCNHKQVKFQNPEQFFNEEYLAYIKKDWHEFLTRLTPNIPAFNEVIVQLKRHVYEIF